MSNAAKFEVPGSGDDGKAYTYNEVGDAFALTDMASQAELDAHLNDVAAAHAASAISFTPGGTIAGSDVQTAVAEVATDAAAALTTHGNLTTSVHGIADTSALVTTSTALGGDLTGTVGNAQIAAGAVGATELATDAVTNAKVADDAIGIAELSATGTPSSSTFLRGDNSWATPSGGASALDDLTDVTITGASTGQVLKYNGSAWVNDTDATAGGTTALDDLSDVTITAAASGDILRHNGTAWVDTPGTTHFEAAGAVAAHEADTTSVHGIADTSALLDTGDIGVSVQGYSAVLAATTASFTTADETKLDGIEAAADVTDETNVVAALSGATLTDLGTPASGDKILLLDASDSDNLKTAAFSTFGGGGSAAPFPMVDNTYHLLQLGDSSQSVTTLTIGVNTIYYWPLYVPTQIQIDGAFFFVNTAGTTARLAIYPTSAGEPAATLVGDSGDISVSSGGAYVSPTWSAWTLPAGAYWAAIIGDNASFAVRQPTTTSVYVPSGGVASATNSGQNISRGASSSFGAFPSTPVAPTSVSASVPFVRWRVQR